MYASIAQINSNKRVFIACLLAFAILVTPIAALALPAEARVDAKPPVATETEAKPEAPAAPQLPQAVPVPLFVPAPPPVSPSLSATLSDDILLPAKKNPGGTINYTAVITNAGVASPADDALAVIFNDPLDNNTTLVAGSIHASPIAHNDTYNWVGNTTLDTNARSLPSVTANDVALTDGITLVTQTNAPTTQGGVVTLSSNGHFVYTPQLGDGGAGFSDTFTYTIQNSADNTLVGTGTVTINMPVRVWYLVAGGSGDGRSLTPSGAPATISTSANLASDILYVYFNAATLNGAFTLDSGQVLEGEGVALVANSITLRVAGSTPTITNTGGSAVTLGGTNLVTGLNISQANNFAIIGSAITGTTNITGVGITNSATGGGISLTTQTGTFNMTNSPISGTTSGTAVFVSGGAGAINFSNSPVSRSTGRLLDIQSKAAGSVLFNGGSTVTGTALTTDGIVLLNNAGTSFTFSNNVQVTTTATGRGIRADNTTGTLVLIMNAASNSVSATGGAALDLEDLAATSALAFTSVSSTNSAIAPAHGIRVVSTVGSINFGNATVTGSDNTGVLLTGNSSTLTFADLDITADSGQRSLLATTNTGAITTTSGTISATNNTGVEITGTSAAVRTPLNMQLTTVSVTGGATAPNGIVLTNTSTSGAPGGFRILSTGGTCTFATPTCTGGRITDTLGADGATGGTGIRLTDVDTIVFNKMRIDNHDNFGIRGHNVNNLTLQDVVIDGTTGNNSTADTDIVNGEDQVRIINLTGSALIDNCFIGGGYENNLRIVNDSGSLNRLTVSDSTIGDLDGAGALRGVDSADGDDNVLFSAADGTLTQMNGTFTNNILNNGRGDVFQAANSDVSAPAAAMDIVFRGNSVSNNHPVIVVAGGGVTFSGTGAMTYDISCNKFRDSKGHGVNVFKQRPSNGQTGGTWSGTIFNNKIGVLGVGDSGGLGHGLQVEAQGNGTLTTLIKNNQVNNYNSAGIHLGVVDANTTGPTALTMNATVIGNLVTQPDPVNAFAAFHALQGAVNPADSTTTLNLKLGGAGAEQNDFADGQAITVDVAFQRATSPMIGTFTLTQGASGVSTPVETVVANNNDNSPALTFSVDPGVSVVGPVPALPAVTDQTCTPPALQFVPGEVAQTNLNQDSPVPENIVSRLSNQVAFAASGEVGNQPTIVNSASLVAKAGGSRPGVSRNSRRSTVEVNPSAADRQQMRFAHARSSRPRAAVANSSSFVAPMSGETVNVGGVSGFTLPAGKTVTIKYSATISTTPTAATVTTQGTISPGAGGNFASFQTNDPDPGASGPAPRATVTNIAMPDITISKSHAGTFKQGDTGKTYTITPRNNGDFATFAGNVVTITDTLPAGLTPTAPIGSHNGWTCNIATQTLTCTRSDSIAAATDFPTITLTVNVDNNAGTPLNNTVTVTAGSGGEVVTNNNSATDPTVIVQAPDLTIDKAHVGNFFQGQTGAQYTITVGNPVGPGPVLSGDTVTVTDTLPVSGFTATGIAGTGWVCTAPSGPCTRTGANTALPAGNNYPVITLTGNVAANAPTGAAAITNSATVSGGGEINTANDTDNDPTTVNVGPDLTILKTHSGIWTQGDTGKTYSIQVSNGGGTTSSGTVTVADSLPAGLTATGLSGGGWTCDPLGGGVAGPATLNCTRADGLAAPGNYPVITLTVTVSNTAPASVTNTATVTNVNDVNGANNSSSDPTAIAALCSTPPANMTNWWTGDNTARDIAGGKDGTVNGLDAFPDVEYSAGKVLNGFDFDGINDLVNVGDVDLPGTFTIDAWVNPTTLATDRAIVSKDDGASLRSYFFHITSGGALQASVNSSGGFTVYQTADGVITTGSFQHVAVTYDGAAGAGAKMLFYKNGVLVPSTVQGGQDAGGLPENNSLAALIGRSATTNNTFLGVIDEVEIFSRALSAAELLTIFNADAGGKCKPSDLKITKTHTDPFLQGSTGNNYTITVSNDGPASTTGTTTVTENVPAGLTATAMSGTGWTCPGSYPVTGPAVRTCTRSDVLTSGSSYPAITLTVTAGVNMASVINTATVSGGGEMDTSDDTATDPTNLSASADLEITSKTDLPDPVTAGQNITYTISFQNNGPSDGQTVTVTDAVPAGTTLVSATFPAGWGRTDSVPVGGTGNVVFAKATVGIAETATFTMVVQVAANTVEGSSISNTATAAGATNDPTPGNNSKTATTNVIQSDIEITSKTDTPDPVDAGSNITYTVNFKNNSAVNTASNVTVTDAVPVGTTLVSATTVSSGWSRTDAVPVGGTGNIVFSNSLVAGAGTATFTIVVKVDTNVLNGTVINNTATAATSSLDTVSANNSASATTLVQVNADLEITSKTDLPDPVTAGQNITYTINFQNNGPSDAQTVTVTDAVPAGTTLVSATFPAGWGRTDSVPVGGTGNVVFAKATVATAEAATFTMVVQVAANAVEGTPISNTATAAGSTNDPTPGNNSKTATTAVQQSDIEITSKTDTPDPVNAGSNITYTVNFKNNSAVNTASNVTVTDPIPTGTTLVSVTTPGGWARTDAVPVGGTGNIGFSKALVAGAETATFTIVVKVDTNVANGTVITNTATAATSSLDNVSANNSASATTTVQVNADLQITSKTGLPDPVTASQNITYAINFVNNGPSDAQGVTITDAVPTGTTFVSAQVTTGTGWTIPSPPAVGGTGNVVFAKTTVAAGESAVFEVVVKVDNNAVEGSIITNNAVAAGTTNDPTPGNNTGTATTTVRQSDIEITSKTDTPDPVTAGQDITYTVNFKNNSANSLASTVTVTDAIPTGTTLVSATTVSPGWARMDAVPNGGTGNIVFSKLVVAVSETAVFTIVVKVGSSVANGTVITNTATAATTSIDTNSANNSASTTTTVQVVADLEITAKTDAPDPVIASQNITYTVNFANNGPSDAQTVTVTDAVPANTTLVSATTASPGWARSDAVAAGGTGNIVFAKAAVPAGETASFTIVVQVNANAVEGSTITNTATAAGAVTDNTPANDSKTTTTTVNQSDIEITSKTDTPDPVTAGNNITYTVNFKNNSAFNTASNVTVTDAIPTGTTFVSATAPAGWSTAAPAVGGTGNIVFSKALVAVSETATFTIVVKVGSSVANATVITNTATAATSSIDTNSANNSASTTTTVQVVADLEITSKTDTPDPVIASQNITYTVNFANNGPSDAQTVTVTDAVPANTTLVSATTVSPGWARSDAVAAGGTGNIVFAKAAVPAGETASFTIVVQVNANAVEGSTITNTATAAGAVTDNTPANDSKTTTTTVNQSDIEITSKTDLPDPVTAGNNITYTVNFKNNSANTTASNVTVTDAVPVGTTFVSATAPAGWSTAAPAVGGTGNIVFSKALVAVSETAVFTIVVKVGASATTTVTNTATAATTSIDTNSANNSASATTTVNTIADLEITSKTDAPDPVVAGNNLTYTINLVNNGPSDAQTVTVTDGVPANTTFVSATLPAGWSRSDAVAAGGTGNLIFAKATVAASETAIFTVVVKVNASTPVGTTLSNTATAASATTDNTPANNAKTATTTVSTEADLLVVKVDSPDPVIAGNNLTYTITVTNNGISDAQSVQLSDTLPASTTLVSFTVPGGWTRTDAVPVGGTGTVTATTPTLVVGGSAQFTLVVNVNASTPHNTVLTNSATVNSTTTDPNPSNNTGTATTTVLSQPDLTITKTHGGNFSGGQVGASYTITVNNIGTGPTTAPVTVTDTVPVGLTPTGPNGVVNGWTCSINGQTLTCTRSDVLAGSSSYPAIILTVNVANPAPLNVVNTATVSGGGEVNTANNTASDPTAINCSADFALNNTSPLLISRFRENGPAGPQDEFVEIYNPSPIPHTVASGNCNGGGYGVYASAGNGTTSDTATLVCYIPNGTVIPAGGYYLCTGVTYSLNNLGLNGGAAGATATGDAPIGCGGTCGANIPDDAGLVLTNKAAPTVASPEGFGAVEFGEVVYDKVGFGPYGPAAPAPGYPAQSSSYCEGGATGCLKPVGDASTGAACTNPSGQFPVVSTPPACYGLAGQYEFLRRQTTFSATDGTIHQDTNNSGEDFILIAPNPAANMGTAVTGVTGVSAVLGAARPYNHNAPPDMPATKLTRSPFDGTDQLGPRNAERRFIPDPTIADLANNPLGTLVLRFKFTNNTGSPINVIRFETDNLSTLCGPQVAAPTTASVGTGDARNLSSTPGCGTGTFTAIFKALNSTSEMVVDGGGTARFVNGTVMEDLSVGAAPGAGPLSPKGGGIDSTVIINPSSDTATVGDGVTGGVGNYSTVIGTTDPAKVLRVRMKFGVVRSGRFILLLVPMAKNAPAP